MASASCLDIQLWSSRVARQILRLAASYPPLLSAQVVQWITAASHFLVGMHVATCGAATCLCLTCTGLLADRLRQGSDYEAKRLGRAVEATLERLYEESRRPSDEMLQGFFELHKGVPRRKVIDVLAA